MSSTKCLKVYLVNNHAIEPSNVIEVRRVDIYETDFNNFCKRLPIIFQNLNDEKFIVTWKDKDNDIITVDTNYEFGIALNEMPIGKTNLYIFYILLQPKQDTIDMLKIKEILHSDVTCNMYEIDEQKQTEEQHRESFAKAETENFQEEAAK
ncbi:uncharacterized protein LOC118644509 isoform X2 [Monomorium pharaonis]|uniref:uncharacterized protein LOC118644509 isoform X2 n=1 Tax=Monomorium pharaonis TaxID=307658 RepID=UPI001747BE64|nr:uncharacterized protein LOC118644509 isoform X2 [Monomorium pharaonis]